MEVTGLSYDEAYAELRSIETATGMSFKEYMRNNLYTISSSMRVRTAAKLISRKKRKNEYIDQICRETGLTPADVKASIRNLNALDLGMRFSPYMYRKYAFYNLDPEAQKAAIELLLERKSLTESFYETLIHSAPSELSYEELSEAYDRIKAITSQVIGENYVNTHFELVKNRYPEGISDQTVKRDIIIDLESITLAAGFSTVEYVMFDLYHKSLPEKLSYVSKKAFQRLVFSVNNANARRVFNNKYNSYLAFKEEYSRDIVRVATSNDFPSFEDFCTKHPVFVFKPSFALQGDGIRKVNVNEYSDSMTMMEELLEENGEFVAEELVSGNPAISVFNPDSLNTIRIITFNAGKRVKGLSIFGPAFRNGQIVYGGSGIYFVNGFFKTGKAGSFIDNGGAGGILTAINQKTGRLIGPGYDESGSEFESHPDSNVCFDYYELPKYKKALKLAKKCALKSPDAGIIGWDLALNDEGKWIIIEGNVLPTLLGQGPAKNGLSKEFYLFCKQMIKEKPAINEQEDASANDEQEDDKYSANEASE